MTDTTTFKARLELSARRQFIVLASVSYVVSSLLLFVALNGIFHSYLVGLTQSQSYSFAIQEWREVANGILGGWGLSPGLRDMCVIDKSGQTLLALPRCPLRADWMQYLAGTGLATARNGFEVRADLEYSLWLWAIFLPILGFGLAGLVFWIFRTPMIRSFQAETLEFLAGYDKNLETASVLESEMQRQAREILQLREQAAVANLASQVAHDIRSPLSALNIVLGQQDLNAENAKGLLRSAISAINNMAEDLLKKRRDGLRKETLQELVEYLPVLQARYSDRIHIQVGARDWAKIDTLLPVSDLIRALNTLVDNGIEALAGDGRVELKIESGAKELRIEVQDSGPGMPAEVRAKAGREAISKGKPSGNGLGLLFVGSLMRRCGGEMTIETEPGQGTCIRLRFPL